MKNKTSRRIAAMLTTLLGATALVVAGVTTSSAAPTTPTQASDEATVASYLSSHPAPSLAADGNDQAKYDADFDSYMESAPWAAVVGQWGCALVTDKPLPSLKADNGSTSGSFLLQFNCNGDHTLSPVAGILTTRSAFLSNPANAAFASAYRDGQAGTLKASDGVLSSGQKAAAPEATEATPSCIQKSLAYLCVLRESTTYVFATVTWDGTTDKLGRVKLGLVGSASCSTGTTLASSGYVEIQHGVVTGVYDDSAPTVTTYASSLDNYDTTLYGLHCGVV